MKSTGLNSSFLWVLVAVVLVNSFVGLCQAAEHEIAWGAPVKGLQAGLAFDNTEGLSTVGETIGFVLKIRNVSDEPVSLEYIERPLKAWIPTVHNSNGAALPVIPPVLPRGGRVMKPSLEPGELLTFDRPRLTVRTFGWEGRITEAVVFADSGKYKVSNSLTFKRDHYRPSGVYPWDGTLTTGELELQVSPAAMDIELEKHGTSATNKEIQAVLRVLGDYVRDHLKAMPMNGSEKWSVKRRAWETQCAALTPGSIRYLGHVAAAFPDEGYRAVACDALDETKQLNAAAFLVAPLSDKSAEVRRKAARSLGHLRSESHIPILLKLLASDPEVDVRASVAYALGHIGSNQATEGLVQVLESEKDTSVKYAATLALGWIADPAALPVLRELRSDPGELADVGLQNIIRNIEDADYWGLGTKAGVSEQELYRHLLNTLDLDAAPVTTERGELTDLFEERRPGSGLYRPREEVLGGFEVVDGKVFYVKHKMVFYIRQSPEGSGADRYYGPFEGNPTDIARQARILENRT